MSVNTKINKYDKVNLNLGLVGFSNLGNTCYMNSALGCLRYTMPLTRYLLNNKIDVDNEFLQSYINLLEETWINNNNSVAPSNFKKQLGKTNKMFNNTRQHDSQEFVIHFLDTIHESLKNEGVKNDKKKSIISDLFNGRFKSTISCPNCDYQSETFETFNNLPVSIDNINLIDCLDQFSSEEILDKDNKYKCDKCQKYVQAKKKMEICDYPQILIIVLKRFSRNRKITRDINFSTEGLYIKANNNIIHYNLFGTVNHYGNLNGGHYTSNVLHPSKGWFCMDDSSCSTVSKKNVVTNAVYIAFFERMV